MLIVLVTGVLFVISLYALVKSNPIIPGLAMGALLGTIYLFHKPRQAFFLLLATRLLLDILWWIPIQVANLNLVSAYTGGATILICFIFISRFKQDIEKHPCINHYLWFVGLLILGALRGLTGTIAIETFFRLFSAPLLLFIGTSLLNRKDDSKRMVLFIMLVGLIPMALSLYHLASGQMNQMFQFSMEGGATKRLLGGYKNPRSHAMMMFIFSACGLFWAIHAKTRTLQILSGVYTGMALTFAHLTYTRATVLAVLACFATFMYTTGRRRTLVIGSGMVALLFMLNTEMQRRFKDLVMVFILVQERDIDTNALARLGSGRIGIWTDSFTGYLESSLPEMLLGRGIGYHWVLTRRSYNPFISVRGGFVDTHNGLLSLLYQVGPIALFLFLAMMFISARNGYKIQQLAEKKWRRDLGALVLSLSVGLLVNQSVSNGLENRPTLAWCYWTLCACGFSLRREMEKESEEKRQRGPPIDGPEEVLRLPASDSH
jgi:hypothetical protein